MPSLNRIEQRRISREWLCELPLSGMSVAEISGGWGKYLPTGQYRQFHYPDHDICKGAFEDDAGKPLKFDLVIADFVWAHLPQPVRAARNLRKMLKRGAYFYLSTPFFLPYNAAPEDYGRWSAKGLRTLLVEAGFDPAAIRAAQWGNRSAALRNLEDHWPPEYRAGVDDLTNDPSFPIVAWALAQKI